jgi:hypothetical protein
MLLNNGVPKENLFVSSRDFHHNLQTHNFLTPSSLQVFPLYMLRVFFVGSFLMVLLFKNDCVIPKHSDQWKDSSMTIKEREFLAML